MNKLNLTVLLLFCVILTSYAQEVHLKAKAHKDTIFLGESVRITLSLEGIQSDIFKKKKPKVKKSGINDDFDKFFSDYEEDTNFKTFVSVSPNLLGKNIIAPYKINLFGKELTSNEVIIQVVKPPLQRVYIEIPAEGVVGERVEIKITSEYNRSFSSRLKNNKIFIINSKSINTSILNGAYSSEADYTVTFTKKGVFEINKSFFENLPEHIILDPVKIEIK